MRRLLTVSLTLLGVFLSTTTTQAAPPGFLPVGPIVAPIPGGGVGPILVPAPRPMPVLPAPVVVVPSISFRVPLIAPQPPVIVQQYQRASYHVMYRICEHDRWQCYDTFFCMEEARIVARSLSRRGYEVAIRIQE